MKSKHDGTSTCSKLAIKQICDCTRKSFSRDRPGAPSSLLIKTGTGSVSGDVKLPQTEPQWPAPKRSSRPEAFKVSERIAPGLLMSECVFGTQREERMDLATPHRCT
uniref:Uncharacterized protein n=1 Tax=Bionectria ochroleuca TaxID=29856 RepID=A0A8H7TRJ0_BIOOC